MKVVVVCSLKRLRWVCEITEMNSGEVVSTQSTEDVVAIEATFPEDVAYKKEMINAMLVLAGTFSGEETRVVWD